MTTQIVPSITDEQLAELEEQYRSEPIPACRVCGSDLAISSMGGGRPTTWNCSNEQALTSSGKMDWDHYEKSRFEQRRVGDSRVLALITRLRAAEKDAARYRWLRDSDWYVGPDTVEADEGGCRLLGYANENSAAEDLDKAIDTAMEQKQ